MLDKDNTRIVVTVSKSTAAKLKQYADEHWRFVSEVAAACIIQGIERPEKLDFGTVYKDRTAGRKGQRRRG